MKKYSIIAALFILLFAMQTKAELPQMMITGQLGYSHPSSDLADYADRGIGVVGVLDYFILENLSIYGTAGFTSWTTTAIEDLIGDEFSSLYDYSLREINVKAGAKFFLADKGFMPYVGAELGLHMLSFKFEYNGPFGMNFSDNAESENQFGVAPLAGFMIAISDNIFVNVNAKYTIISSNIFQTGIDEIDDELNPDISFHYIGINAGVSIGL
jgi:opacity protein-like surface antigen